ncbi:hypothetical protein CapIbe_020254 [Capra ibex]
MIFSHNKSRGSFLVCFRHSVMSSRTWFPSIWRLYHPPILYARRLEWSHSRVQLFAAARLLWLSRVPLFATLWTVSCQAPLSMGFSRCRHHKLLNIYRAITNCLQLCWNLSAINTLQHTDACCSCHRRVGW